MTIHDTSSSRRAVLQGLAPALAIGVYVATPHAVVRAEPAGAGAGCNIRAQHLPASSRRTTPSPCCASTSSSGRDRSPAWRRWLPRSSTPTGRRCAPTTRRRIRSSTTTWRSACRAPAARRAIANSYEQMRKVGAAARADAGRGGGARAWNVPAGEITVENGVIRHALRQAGGRFGEFAQAAMQMPVPERAEAEGSVDLQADRQGRRGEAARQRRQDERHGASSPSTSTSRTC